MTSILNVSNSIGKKTAQRMKEIGIDSIEKLASSSIEDLLVRMALEFQRLKTIYSLQRSIFKELMLGRKYII